MKQFSLHIGIQYENPPAKLYGCVNDAKHLRQCLIDQYHFKPENCELLLEKDATTSRIISKLFGLAFLSHRYRNSVFFVSYSGHGTQQGDRTGDERDGRDECLVPVDAQRNGLITDDLLNTIIGQFHPSSRVTWIQDSCMSGSGLDLKYKYISGNKSVTDNGDCNVKAQVIMVSGCKDNQYSMDTVIDDKPQGAMTASLLHVLGETDYSITCYALLSKMRKFLEVNNYDQVPQMTSSIRLHHCARFAHQGNAKSKSFL